MGVGGGTMGEEREGGRLGRFICYLEASGWNVYQYKG